MNGHISPEGITKDLEALSAAGIGGVLNYIAGIAMPKGPVESFSKVWYDFLEHTVTEADRLGLEYMMHNCPGWSSSGGPWVTPEISMQQVVWSETFIIGGKKINRGFDFFHLPASASLRDFLSTQNKCLSQIYILKN